MTKINIQFEFKDGPWGGGNQFLKALRNEWISSGNYAKEPEEADCILFNSHHLLDRVLKIKKRYPEKIFAHRIDGPIFLIRNKDLSIDQKLFKFNRSVADVTIFQSSWSREECIKLGHTPNQFECIIYNAPDINIFHEVPDNRKDREKTAIIATSWSSNFRKGFEIYKYLDLNLDFSKYSFTFVGNSPIKFKNINHITPHSSENLAKLLRKHDIFITASMRDPCSNSLIEALNCGLPAVALRDGGHPELIGEGGVCFSSHEDVLGAIDKVADNLSGYKNMIPQRSIQDSSKKYLEIINDAIRARKAGNLIPKTPGLMDTIAIKLSALRNPFR